MKTKNETLRGMTVILMAVILFAAIFAIPVPAAHASETYSKMCTIWSKADGEFTILDDEDQLWAFNADSDSFIVGQEVKAVFSDMGTSDNIFDDEVIVVNPIASPYDDVIVGPFGYYVLGAIAMKTYPDQSTVWFVDEFEDDWFFNGFCPVNPGDRVTLIINSNGTTDDFSDDYIEDVLFSDCDVD